MFNLGMSELLIIFLIILLLFGAKRLPELARALGKSIREFTDAGRDIKRGIRDIEDAGKKSKQGHDDGESKVEETNRGEHKEDG